MRSNLHEARLADIDALPRVVRATTRREPKLGATARSFASSRVNWRKYSVKNSGTDNKAAKDLSKRSKRVIP